MVFRLIARLDIKPPDLVKGIHLEGVKKVGDPAIYAERYYNAGVDEVAYQDVVASLYGRNALGELVTSATRSVFVPVSVGGGIRSVEDAIAITRAGADRISVNTAAVANPQLITDLARTIGQQAVIVTVEAKKSTRGWDLLVDSGREETGMDALAWIRDLESLGAGEIVVTSIDREGTLSGCDLDLCQVARSLTALPLIAHGGAAEVRDVLAVADLGLEGVQVAKALHSGLLDPTEAKKTLSDAGHEVRS